MSGGEDLGLVEHKMTRSHGVDIDRKAISSRKNIAKCLVMDASEFFTSDKRQPSLHYRSGSTVAKRTNSSPARKLVSTTKSSCFSQTTVKLHSDLRVGF